VRAWESIRDIGITGTGLAIVWSQLLLWVIVSRTPSDVLLAVGLGMLVPAAGAHVKTVLGSPGAGSSSDSLPPPLPPPSLPSSLPEVETGGD